MADEYRAGQGGDAGVEGGAQGRAVPGADGRGQAPEPAMPGIRVLVVEDDAVDRIALRRALAQATDVHEFREAEAVLPAIALLAAEPFDCVFLDYNLPDGDGLTFLRGVRAAGIAVPVVMLTGQQDGRVAGQLAQAGAADYIDKSDLSTPRLLQALRRAVPAMRRTPTPTAD